MPSLILDSDLERRLIQDRQSRGADRYDEVWEGTYMMAPLANNEHQWLVMRLARPFDEVITDHSLGEVYPGCNVSDRKLDWKDNYRIPDIAIFLTDNPAINHETFWQGGPDIVVEIVSEGDYSREKLAFYACVGTKEVLLLDRKPWRWECYRLVDGSMKLVATNQTESDSPISSKVSGLEFALRSNETGSRPTIVVSQTGTDQRWTI